MSLPQEGAKIATSVVGALASTPVVLALVLFNVLYMAGSFYAQLEAQKRFIESTKVWEQMVEKAMAYCPHQDRADDSEDIPLPRPRPVDPAL